MEMRRIEAFCKVVEFKSFTKAAEALFLSQPTISEHVRSLEESVGEKLIDRLGREVAPTPAGRILYQYARNIIQMRDEVIQALEQFRGRLSGRLILGGSTIPGTYLLPKIIGDFKTTYPDIQITLKIGDTADIAEQVMDGNLEAGVIGSKWTDRRIVSEELCHDDLVLAVYPGHPWAKTAKISLAELAGQPFISRERGSGTRTVTQKILDDNNFDSGKLNSIAEMGSTEAVRQGIKAKIGVSILSRQAVAEDIDHGAIVSVDIKGLRLSRPIFLVQRKNRQNSPLCATFLGIPPS